MNLGLVVVGKAPQPGRVKTRLCPPLTPKAAARLYGAFLEDTLALARRFLARHAAESAVYLLHPSDSARGLERYLAGATHLLAQRGATLGDALSGAFDQVTSRGHEAAIVIGSDLPHLPLACLSVAAAAVKTHDVALGPAEDGGYYLIAARRAHPALFEGIAWSTEVVLQQTLERAAAAGLSARLTPPCWDVDRASDVQRLVRYLEGVAPSVAPQTRAALARLRSASLLPVALLPEA